MNYKDYYPLGAADDRYAPYNEKESPEQSFDVECSVTMVVQTEVVTNDYYTFTEYDEDGAHDVDDTTDTDWVTAFKESHCTPKQLIAKLKEQTAEILAATKINDKKKIAECNEIIRECDIWLKSQEEMEVYK